MTTESWGKNNEGKVELVILQKHALASTQLQNDKMNFVQLLLLCLVKAYLTTGGVVSFSFF